TGRTRLRAPMPTSRRTRIRTRTSKRRAHTAQASADDPARTVPRSAQLVERLAAPARPIAAPPQQHDQAAGHGREPDDGQERRPHAVEEVQAYDEQDRAGGHVRE